MASCYQLEGPQTPDSPCALWYLWVRTGLISVRDCVCLAVCNGSKAHSDTELQKFVRYQSSMYTNVQCIILPYCQQDMYYWSSVTYLISDQRKELDKLSV